MRPLLLKMSAFGPYAGQVSIDMDKLGDQGLYLVTGDTGAGKTTIFDAICFALFGEASGKNRETKMLRSKYANPDTPTEVELTFIHDGKEYTVKRNPEYLRPAKKGDGEKKQTSDATLILPNGTVITKYKDVTNKIEDLLGVNKDQFSQISMLAQGDFLKLLLAETRDRIVIFRELFKTGAYESLQKELESKQREVYIEVEDGRKRVDTHISNIQIDEDDLEYVNVEKAKNNELTLQETIELLDKLNSKDEKDYASLNKELKDIEKNLKDANDKLAKANALNSTKISLENNEKKLKELIPEEKKLNEKLKKAALDLKNKDSLIKEATKIYAELKNYDKYDEIQDEIDSYKEDLKDIKSNLVSLTKDQKTKTSEIDKSKKELNSFKDESVIIEKNNNEIEKIKSLNEKIEDLEDEYNSYISNKGKLKNAQFEYTKNDKVYNDLKTKYDQMDQNFRDSQAGILASKLIVGQKCPVCGSTTHPCKAHMPNKVPNEQELKAIKNELDIAQKKRNESSNNASSINTLVNSKEKELIKKSKELFKTSDLDNLEGLIDDEKVKNYKKISALEEKNEKAQEKVERKEELEDLIPDLEKELKDIEKEINKDKVELGKLETSITKSEKQAESIKKNLKYSNRSKAESEYNKLNNKAEELQETYDEINEESKVKTNELNKRKAEIEAQKETLKNAENIDYEKESNKANELNALKEEKNELVLNINHRLGTNKDIRKNIEKEEANIAVLEKKLQWITTLANTANGKLSGKDRIMLETYVQTIYFDRIINKANLRLMTMSSGQYELRRMKEASNLKSQSGLELEVVDHYNGTSRSVKTLSGGESFMASLSLALGMSDEIQQSAGGIKVDTMFVDEGFGSLDQDTLDQAYNALVGITEGKKLIGIISHVEELKRKIDKQIVVTKEKSNGSSVKLVI